MDTYKTNVSDETLQQLLSYKSFFTTSYNRSTSESIGVEEFFQMWEVTSFILPFNYQEWLADKHIDPFDYQMYIRQMKEASQENFRKMALIILRIERFNAGYLTKLEEAGLFTIFFDKIEQFKKETL